MPGKIFINYRRLDAEAWADRLYERLRAQLPAAKVFMDIDGNIPLGVPWVQWIESHVAACDLMLVLIGRSWVAEFEARSAAGERDFVRIEIESALSRKIPIVPVLLGDAPVPSAASLPASIRSLLELQATRMQRASFEADTKVLIEGVVRSIELTRAEGAEPARPEGYQSQNRDREERLKREQKDLEDEERIWADAKWSRSQAGMRAYLERYGSNARHREEAQRLLAQWSAEEKQRKAEEEPRKSAKAAPTPATQATSPARKDPEWVVWVAGVGGFLVLAFIGLETGIGEWVNGVGQHVRQNYGSWADGLLGFGWVLIVLASWVIVTTLIAWALQLLIGKR